MDVSSFDDLSRRVSTSLSRRRALVPVAGALGGVLTSLLGSSVDAGKKKRKNKNKKKGEKCGSVRCGANQFCCDDLAGTCCSKKGTMCCNAGSGTGTCCAGANACGKPYGNDAAPAECCPPERQWFTYTGLMRCCPSGTRSLGTGITADDGPCCPEEKYCSTSKTGGICCTDLAPICTDRSTGQCCSEADMCGSECCLGIFACCNGRCCPYGQICDGGACKCPTGVMQCGETCCPRYTVACAGNQCLKECDLEGPCGG